MAAVAVEFNTRKMRYTGEAMAAFKSRDANKPLPGCNNREDDISSCRPLMPEAPFSDRFWMSRVHQAHPPKAVDTRKIGPYPLTSYVAPWAIDALVNYQPSKEVHELVKPFAEELHDLIEKERAVSTGLHDLDVIELTYQLTLEIGANILLAADATVDPVDLSSELAPSTATNDDHFAPWGKLLTGIDCDPPILAMFPINLMMNQSFAYEPTSLQADYVYSALTGVDWAQGNNKFSARLDAFEKQARASVPDLDDRVSGQDRSYWRIAHAYLRAMNRCENSRSFKSPSTAAIQHNLDPDLVIAFRAIDTIGSAYMCSDGACWFDVPGMDSLANSGFINDLMDLHADIKTGETRNLVRLLYPSGVTMDQAMQTASTFLAGELCELFRGHYRARFNSREDGRVAATSPPYSFCRARKRQIFAIMKAYINQYPDFWEWTWEIWRLAKEQVTEAGISETFVCALKRAAKREPLPDSPRTTFYDQYYDMIEDGKVEMQKRQPLGVSDDVVPVVRELYTLWHEKLRDGRKEPGWGHEFDMQSDSLFGQAGEILAARGEGISDDMYKFSIAYGRLSMTLPLVAYHTIAAIIMAHGVVN